MGPENVVAVGQSVGFEVRVDAAESRLRLDGFRPLLEARLGRRMLEPLREISQPVQLRLVQLALLTGLEQATEAEILAHPPTGSGLLGVRQSLCESVEGSLGPSKRLVFRGDVDQAKSSEGSEAGAASAVLFRKIGYFSMKCRSVATTGEPAEYVLPGKIDGLTLSCLQKCLSFGPLGREELSGRMGQDQVHRHHHGRNQKAGRRRRLRLSSSPIARWIARAKMKVWCTSVRFA